MDLMSRKPLTVRSDDRTVTALKELSVALGWPVNRIVNEAVGMYLAARIPDVERELTAQLERLRAYKRSDPDFEHAIGAFAKAEADLDDPATGTVSAANSPVRAEIRDLLSA